MDHKEFETLVSKLERVAKTKPTGYKARVLGLAILGYGYIFLVLVVVITIVGGLVLFLILTKSAVYLMVKYAILPLVIFSVVIVRAMWVRIIAPEGIELKCEDFLVLSDALEKIRKQLKGPRIHTVLLNGEYNAAISQIPRLGIFGWQKNYLILGLPLMQALSPEHLLAIIAHEYGHLSGSYGKFSSWIYRLRQTWYQVMEAFDQEDTFGNAVFSKFFDWYVPYFNAYSFVHARANEYKADRCSAELTTPAKAAEALTSIYVRGKFLDEDFWPRLNQRADKDPNPTTTLYAETGDRLRDGLNINDAKRWLEQSMADKTGTVDTHPSLNDRLKALDQEPRLPEPIQTSAAEVFLRDGHDFLLKHLSKMWCEHLHLRWQERHEYVHTALARLEELEEKQQQDLSVEEVYDYALLTEEFRPDAEHITFYKAVLEYNAEHVGANYVIGRLMLVQGDDTGRAFIEKAMDLDNNAIAPGCELVYNYLIDRDRKQEAIPYEKRFYEGVEFEKRVQAERDNIHLNDNYIPHDAPPEVIEGLTKQLRKYKQIKTAYFVQKKIGLSNSPLFVLGLIRSPRSPDYLRDPRNDRKLIQKLVDEIKFPYDIFYLVLSNDNEEFSKIIANIEGALI
ncbi:MAG: M48 family metallopeptidase, partial [Desulfobacterales bacterium]